MTDVVEPPWAEYSIDEAPFVRRPSPWWRLIWPLPQEKRLTSDEPCKSVAKMLNNSLWNPPSVIFLQVRSGTRIKLSFPPPNQTSTAEGYHGQWYWKPPKGLGEPTGTRERERAEPGWAWLGGQQDFHGSLLLPLTAPTFPVLVLHTAGQCPLKCPLQWHPQQKHAMVEKSLYSNTTFPGDP